MIVICRADAPDALEVAEETDFTRLSLRLTGDARDPASRFAGLGRWSDSEHVYIDPVRIREASSLRGDPAWERRFAEMIEFAAAHGWTDDEGRVRIHVA